MKKNNGLKIFILFIVFGFLLCLFIDSDNTEHNFSNDPKVFNILSSNENDIMEESIKSFSRKKDQKVKITYMGDLEMIDELNVNSEKYDAVWISNSMWLYLLNNSSILKDSKSMSISPVVFGIKKSKAKDLNLINKEITNEQILNLIKNKKLKYVMSSVTQTNTGATAYIGFLNSLAGNPEVLSEDIIRDKKVVKDLKTLFSGVQRVSGDDKYLEKMFVNSTEYDSVIASESSLININKKLKNKNKEELYFLYPTDGLAVNDSTLAFINNDEGKEEFFVEMQKYLLSDKGQALLASNGLRTWYGGINKSANEKVFNPDWGINTSKYLNVTKFPSKRLITGALNLYIEEIRKPSHVVFCLDYSGSMNGTGIIDLRNSMKYILDYTASSKDMLQFSKNDKITVITFSTEVNDVWSSVGKNTKNLIAGIERKEPSGTTALYDAVNRGLDILEAESDEYTKSIIAMTDGVINVGTFDSVRRKYRSYNSNVPIYSITFGSASERQLNELADLSNAKIFDGKRNLLKAFKEVRGYN